MVLGQSCTLQTITISSHSHASRASQNPSKLPRLLSLLLTSCALVFANTALLALDDVPCCILKVICRAYHNDSRGTGVLVVTFASSPRWPVPIVNWRWRDEVAGGKRVALFARFDWWAVFDDWRWERGKAIVRWWSNIHQECCRFGDCYGERGSEEGLMRFAYKGSVFSLSDSEPSGIFEIRQHLPS